MLVRRGVLSGVTLLEEAARPAGVALLEEAARPAGVALCVPFGTVASCLFLLDSVAWCKRAELRSALFSREGVPGTLAGIGNGGTSGLRDACARLVAGGCGCKGFVIAIPFACTAAGSAAGSFWCKGSVPEAAFAAAGSTDACLSVNEFVLLARDSVLSVLEFLGLFWNERRMTPPPSRDVDLSVDVVLPATLLARDDGLDAFPADNPLPPFPCTWLS